MIQFWNQIASNEQVKSVYFALKMFCFKYLFNLIKTLCCFYKSYRQTLDFNKLKTHLKDDYSTETKIMKILKD